MSTNVSSVVKHFPKPQNGFQTSLASTISSGATTVPLNSVAGFSNGDVAVLVVDPLNASSKQVFTGTVDTSGVQLTNVVWTAGTNQSHNGGTTVVDYTTATHIAMISKGILVHADQDGTLAAGAVDNAAVLASDVVTTAKILDANVTNAKLAQNVAWTTYTPTFANVTVGSGTVAGAYQKFGKTVHFRASFTLAGGSAVTGNVTVSLPSTASAGTSTAVAFPIGTGSYVDAGVNTYIGIVTMASTTTAALRFPASGTNGRGDPVSTSNPFVFGSGDSVAVVGTYEEA